jgi:hypothetical protein
MTEFAQGVWAGLAVGALAGFCVALVFVRLR